MHRSSFRLVALAVVVAFGMSGCGGTKEKPVKVEGVVLLDGQPLGGATVRYLPMDGKGQSAYGLTEDDGTFHLSCQNGIEGAFRGQYKVVITKGAEQTIDVPADPKAAQEMADRMMRGAVGKKKQASRAKPSSILPAEYADEAKTPLKEIVPPPEGKATLKLQSRKS